MHHTLCYVSSSTKSLTASDLEHLFRVNKRNNTEHDVTGILIYNDGNFLQILEGKKLTIKNLFKKINNDQRHFNIIQLIDKPIEERIFHEYKSGFIHFENPKQKQELYNYIEWLKEAEIKNVDEIIQLIENFY